MLSLQVSDCTIHMIPDPQTLSWSHYAFASEYVAEQVLVHLLTRDRDQLEVFLSSSWGLSELAHVRGRLFEHFVHHVLPRGGEYELRDLHDGEFVWVRLSASCTGCRFGCCRGGAGGGGGGGQMVVRNDYSHIPCTLAPEQHACLRPSDVMALCFHNR